MSLCFATIIFFSEALGPRDCERNLTMNNIAKSIVYVPNGTVCFECVEEYFSLPFTFIIRDRIVNSSYPLAQTVHTRDIVNILVVPNTEKVFSTSSATTVKCCERLIPGSSECDTALNKIKADVFLYYSKSFPIGFSITYFPLSIQPSSGQWRDYSE